MKKNKPEYHRICSQCNTEIWYSDTFFKCDCYQVIAIDNDGLLVPMFMPYFWIIREFVE